MPDNQPTNTVGLVSQYASQPIKKHTSQSICQTTSHQTHWSVNIPDNQPTNTVAIQYARQPASKHTIVAVNFHQRRVFFADFSVNFASTLFNYSGAYPENFVKFE